MTRDTESYTPVDLIEVRLDGVTIGAVGEADPSGAHPFAWADGYTGPQLAPIHMPVRPESVPYLFTGLSRQTWHGLPPMIADALPDRFGNAVIDAWLARRGIDKRDIGPLDRLAYLGQRAMGALSFHPAADRPDTAYGPLALADTVASARRVVSGKVTDRDDLEQLIRVGSSAGGARAKAVVGYNPATGQFRTDADPADGFEHWLVKLDGVSDASRELGDPAGYGIIEYAYFNMARDAGIDMADCRLVAESDRHHFLTRRFDRDVDGDGQVLRHHLLTLCAADHLDFNVPRAHGYEQYLAAVNAMGVPRRQLTEAFRRVVFNVAAVNCDDHTKNLAFLLRHGTDTWDLAPAYDIAYAHNPDGSWTSAHQMGVGGKFAGISRQDLAELGDAFAVPGHRDALEQVVAAVGRWPEHAEQAGVPGERIAGIATAIAEVGLR